MKTLSKITETLKQFEGTYGIDIVNAEQGSEAWLKAKLGVISASNISKVVAKKDSETRATYMAELVAQVCTGDQEELNSKALDWGRAHEAAARSSYEFAADCKIEQVPFVFKDENFREGASPDGLLGLKGLELKCPYNAVHYVKFFCNDKIKKEYEWQANYCMRILGAMEWDFVQYHPNMRVNPIKILTLEIDEEKQKTLDDAVPQFIHEMDGMLEKLGVEWGSQWA